MKDFDLRKYLAENKLLKEEKTFNVYNDDGEPVLVNLDKSTPSQEKLIRWEMPNITEPETSEEAQEIANEIMQLNSVEDVKQYYGYKRGWFNSSLKNLVGDAMVVYSSLSENKLLKENIDEGRMKDPSRSIKMGKYPQVSSDTPVPMNVKYLTTNGEKLTMKVQAKNRKEAVDAVKSKDPNFKAEIKTDFVYDKDGNKLVKENIQDEDLLDKIKK